MANKTQIAQYFDSVSENRDALLDSHIIVRYEQKVRQQAVLSSLSPQAGDLVLDIGCGNGRDLRAYAQMGVVAVGVDLSIGMLQDARKELERVRLLGHVSLLAGDSTILPFSEMTFNKVACSEVIEHIPEFERVFCEIYRVLKPGGMFVITTPNRSSLYGLYRRFEEFWIALKRRLKKHTQQSVHSGHPYDMWKTKMEVLKAAQGAGLEVLRVGGYCYIPSHFTYQLPRFVQRVIVDITGILEKPLSQLFPSNGYTIGILGRKC